MSDPVQQKLKRPNTFVRRRCLSLRSLDLVRAGARAKLSSVTKYKGQKSVRTGGDRHPAAPDEGQRIRRSPSHEEKTSVDWYTEVEHPVALVCPSYTKRRQGPAYLSARSRLLATSCHSQAFA